MVIRADRKSTNPSEQRYRILPRCGSHKIEFIRERAVDTRFFTARHKPLFLNITFRVSTRRCRLSLFVKTKVLVFVHGTTPNIARSNPREPGGRYDTFWKALQSLKPERERGDALTRSPRRSLPRAALLPRVIVMSHCLSCGASEATIFSKRGSPRNGSQKGWSLRYP
jgi:hypothetical protein